MNTRKDSASKPVDTFFAPPKKVSKERRPKSQRTRLIAFTLAVISMRRDCVFDDTLAPAPKLNPRSMPPTLAASDFGLPTHTR